MNMPRLVKVGELPSSPTSMSATSPIPAPTITTTQAPGKRGPVGMGPRTDYSRVNTGLPQAADAGATEQKSAPPRGAEALPKLASGEEFMGNLAGRPSLGSMVKQAVAETAQRVRVTNEAHLQAVKTAEAKKCEKCGKEKCSCMGKTASAALSSDDLVGSLANALEYGADLLRKEAASMGGPYNLTEHKVGNPPGVSEASGGPTLKDQHGQGVNIVPKSTPEQKAMPQEHGATQLENTIAHGVPGEMPANIVSGKHASVVDMVRAKLASAKVATDEHEKKETEGLREAEKGIKKTEKAHFSEPENKGEKDEKKEGMAGLVDGLAAHIKQAEDAINPAQISAGAAVPPDTSAAGQPGGEPVGGAPQGPSSLVGSNEAAQNYTKGQSHGPRRTELGKYFNEPALSMAHDTTLRDVFSHTGQAGTKFASAGSMQTTAARVLLTKLAQGITPKPEEA